MISDEIRHKLMTAIEANSKCSQRDLAHELGMSLGKVNYCLRALIRQGLIKVANFKNSNNRKAYMYMLTPAGVGKKSQITMRFFQMKMQEYESLRLEIEQLSREVSNEKSS